MDKTKEAADTIEYFLNQFDPKDPKAQLVLEILLKVIYNIPDLEEKKD